MRRRTKAAIAAAAVGTLFVAPALTAQAAPSTSAATTSNYLISVCLTIRPNAPICIQI